MKVLKGLKKPYEQEQALTFGEMLCAVVRVILSLDQAARISSVSP